MRSATIALALLAMGCGRTHYVAEGVPRADVMIELTHDVEVAPDALVHDAGSIDGAFVLESSERSSGRFAVPVLPRPTHYLFTTRIARPCLGPPRVARIGARDPVSLGSSDHCVAPFSRDGSSRARGAEVLLECSAELDQVPLEGAGYWIRYSVRADRTCVASCAPVLPSGAEVPCGADEEAVRR